MNVKINFLVNEHYKVWYNINRCTYQENFKISVKKQNKLIGFDR